MLGARSSNNVLTLRYRWRRHANSIMYSNRNIHRFSSSEKEVEAQRNDGYVLTRSQRRALRKINPSGLDDNEGSDERLAQTLEQLKMDALRQEMEHDKENPMPWYTLLAYPSRALWRSSSKLPPQFLRDERFEIIKKSERTNKQLKRTYDRIISNHSLLSVHREKERRRLVNGGKVEDDTLAVPKSLSAKNGKTADKSIKPVYYKPEQSICSLKYRLLPNFQIAKRVLSETQSLLGKEVFQPRKVLDVGIGVGSSTAAALDVFRLIEDGEKVYDGIEWVHGIDPSQSMRDVASAILKNILKSGEGKRARVTLADSLTSSSAEGQTANSATGTFDLALCTYTLCELPSAVASLSTAAVIWEKLAPNGVAIFIEPGTPDGFSALRSVRSMLLDCCPPDDRFKDDEDYTKMGGDEEAHVIAPCTHHGTCPMERHKNFFQKEMNSFDADEGHRTMENSFEDIEEEEEEEEEIELGDGLDGWDGENFDQNLENSHGVKETDVFNSAFCSFVHSLPGGNKVKRGEKISYLVVQKRIVGERSVDAFDSSFVEGVNIVDLLAEVIQTGRNNSKQIKKKERDPLLNKAIEIEDRYVDSDEDNLNLELLQGDTNRRSWGRIIRAPIKKKGHIILDYCASNHNEDEDVGKIYRQKISRGQSKKSAPGMYHASRKGRWGGLWPHIVGRMPDKDPQP